MRPHLIGKLTYTFNKVLVWFPLSSDQLPHNWNHLEGVLIVHPKRCTFGQEIITGLITLFQVYKHISCRNSCAIAL